VAREAILNGIAEANRYAGASRGALTEALARKHGVGEEGIVLGNGSTEILQMGVQSLLNPSLRLVAPRPTYEDVFEFADPHPWVEVRAVPLTPTFAHDLAAMRDAAVGVSGAVLVYVCNPNNPTGTLTPTDEIVAWIREAPANVHFLVDEAYFEFVDSPAYRSLDLMAWENPNLVVARTFSKVYGMAGMRLGYAVAHPDTARRLRAFAPGTNTNHLALVAGLAALGDREWVAATVSENLRSRQITRGVLEELGLEHLPSHTNFVMHRVPGDLAEYIRRMAGAGIRVGRPFPPMVGHSRVSLGLPKEMERFAETLRDFRGRGWV
jgi:histidinol-phosphate aminotransferase